MHIVHFIYLLKITLGWDLIQPSPGLGGVNKHLQSEIGNLSQLFTIGIVGIYAETLAVYIELIKEVSH